MSARQLIVLAVAFVAAIGALLMIRGMGQRREAPPAQTENIAGEQVLVVTKDVPPGVRLEPADIAWRTFPTDSVNEGFVLASAQSTAQADYAGAVTRRAFLQGEPVTQGSLVMPEGRGILAAMLKPGYRAIAVSIEQTTAAGGYVQPNDQVDVLLTVGDSDNRRTSLLMENVRILALDDAVAAPNANGAATARSNGRIAVLELSAADARALTQADAGGRITLSLRGVEAEPPGLQVPSAQRGGQSGAIRVHAFGRVSGGGQ